MYFHIIGHRIAQYACKQSDLSSGVCCFLSKISMLFFF
jgi:hypothetical protein